MKHKTPGTPPRVSTGRYTFKKQTKPENILRRGPLAESGAATQIWYVAPDLVSVSHDAHDRTNLIVDIAEDGHVAIGAKANRLDPEKMIHDLTLQRSDGKVKATAVLPTVNLRELLEPGETDLYLSARKASIAAYFCGAYGIADNGGDEWGKKTYMLKTDVSHLAHEERRWMTVSTADVVAEMWNRDGRLEDFRDDIRDNTLITRLRKQLDLVGSTT